MHTGEIQPWICRMSVTVGGECVTGTISLPSPWGLHLPLLKHAGAAVLRTGNRNYRDLARLPLHLLPHPRILLSPSAGSACCCWCVLPRPGSCGASSTRSCGTGGNTGRNRALSAESQLPPGFQPGPSRGNLVSARAVAESQWAGSVCDG